MGKVRELGVGTGFNAATGEYGDLAGEGVIDPVKVTKAALGHAASIAAMILTTDSAVVEAPEDTHEHAGGGHHGHSHGGHGHSHLEGPLPPPDTLRAPGAPGRGPFHPVA